MSLTLLNRKSSFVHFLDGYFGTVMSHLFSICKCLWNKIRLPSLQILIKIRHYHTEKKGIMIYTFKMLIFPVKRQVERSNSLKIFSKYELKILLFSQNQKVLFLMQNIITHITRLHFHQTLS